MSVTGILPALYVCVWGGRGVGVCVCEYFSGLEAAFMSVPSVENGYASEGQPLCCTGLPTLFSEEPNAFIWCWIFVISPWNYNWEHRIHLGPAEWSPPIPACGHEQKWNQLLHCHPILSLSSRQLLLLDVFDVSNIVVHIHIMTAIQAISFPAWGSLAVSPNLKCLCHHVTPKVVPYFSSFRLWVALWLGFVEPDAIMSCVFQPLSCDLG